MSVGYNYEVEECCAASIQTRWHCSNRFDTGSNFNEETELSWLSVVV